eukprot:CAMPEP_0117061400 /NCGR_PEP_ID=MMETSP0472-20121206/42724_1 /TAXON_ID=693140 ORGANISM="Tiarina fusus, Strain LIS" /NCGR_SAMPLE_ID=MMETSP0472 /ASSEMBLY_ACC=CAM_ASM_000603 /LENGTH=68 /DNA_ID=CAMNT_0004780019 /DNA_START=349 /DNA_END=552 /DNA_ORIENTATION=+
MAGALIFPIIKRAADGCDEKRFATNGVEENVLLGRVELIEQGDVWAAQKAPVLGTSVVMATDVVRGVP